MRFYEASYGESPSNKRLNFGNLAEIEHAYRRRSSTMTLSLIVNGWPPPKDAIGISGDAKTACATAMLQINGHRPASGDETAMTFSPVNEHRIATWSPRIIFMQYCRASRKSGAEDFNPVPQCHWPESH